MSQFELINSSDPYFLEADDFEVIAVAVCALGKGMYGAREVGGARKVPQFLFGGHDGWFVAQFGRTFEASALDVVVNRRAALIACLESVAMPAGRTRSSLIDIGAAAKWWAEELRK